MAKLIKGFYYVVSTTSDKVYKIDKDLRCTCKGYEYRRTCKHVKEVIKELNEGHFVPENNCVLTREWNLQGNRIMMNAEESRFF
jgi:hypothetical protein